MITNLLQRKTFIKQMCGAGMAQAVRTIMRQLAAKRSNVNSDRAGGTARHHRPMRFV
jgi:hypothetical protein